MLKKIGEVINELVEEKAKLRKERKILEYYREKQMENENYYMLASSAVLEYLEKLKEKNYMAEYHSKFEYFYSIDRTGSFPSELGFTLDAYTDLIRGVVGYFAINNDEYNVNLEELFSMGIDITKYLNENGCIDVNAFRKNFMLIYEIINGIPFIKNPPEDNFRQGVLLLLDRDAVTGSAEFYTKKEFYTSSLFDEKNGRYYLSPEYILGYVSVDENCNCEYIGKGHNYNKNAIKSKKIGVKK